MNIKEIVRLPDPRKNVKIEFREVVRDLHHKPHVLIRVRITGWHFPQRALEPFAVVGDVVSRFVIIENDGATADAFFDAALPAASMVSFGYGKVIHWDFDAKFSPERMLRLDRKQLPKGFVELGAK